MAIVTIGAICDAVADTLSTTAGIERTQSYDELTEGMNTWPTLQVYPDNWEVSFESETDRLSFVDAVTGIPGHRQTHITLILDLVVRPRSQLAEDWRAAVDLASALHDKLDEEGACPHFGLDGIRSFRWSAQRVLYPYAQMRYVGFRFTLELRIF
jgi:hypothetical protein